MNSRPARRRLAFGLFGESGDLVIESANISGVYM